MVDRSWWPVELTEGPVTVRPLRRRDARAWIRLRAENAEWLRPWEATSPHGSQAVTFGTMVRGNDRMAREGQGYPFAICVNGALAGQITLSCLVWGSMRSGALGYWIDQSVAGRGVMPTAVSLVADHAFFVMALHRIEINIRPENQASLRVVDKLGFRDEGVRRRFLHIDGQWCDHRTFALTADEVPGGLLRRWRAARASAD